MSIQTDIQDMIGPEFDVEVDGHTLEVKLGLTLSARILMAAEFSSGGTKEEIIRRQRDRILIDFKRKLTELLWKYLGEV